jgi:hypothetical protein
LSAGAHWTLAVAFARAWYPFGAGKISSASSSSNAAPIGENFFDRTRRWSNNALDDLAEITDDRTAASCSANTSCWSLRRAPCDRD